MTSRTVLIDRHPGRSSQSIGVARALGTDPDLIHEPSVGVVGTKGDSQCYLGVMSKVDAIHDELKGRIGSGQGQLKLAGEHFDQIPQVAGTGLDICFGVCELFLDGRILVGFHAIALCRRRNQLHQAHGTLG